jgi:hypothetical protein
VSFGIGSIAVYNRCWDTSDFASFFSLGLVDAHVITGFGQAT